MISLTVQEYANTKKCIFFRMYPFNGSLEPPASSLSGLFLDLDDEESWMTKHIDNSISLENLIKLLFLGCFPKWNCLIREVKDIFMLTYIGFVCLCGVGWFLSDSAIIDGFFSTTKKADSNYIGASWFSSKVQKQSAEKSIENYLTKTCRVLAYFYLLNFGA